MNWDRMDLAAMNWPLDSDEPSPVTIVFLLSFTTVTIWIMANLYRAVIIMEYANVVHEYHDKSPGDLTDAPWPSFNPFVLYNRYVARAKQKAFDRRIVSVRRRDEQLGEARQRKKQKEFMEAIRRAEKEGKSHTRKSPSKGKDRGASPRR